MTDNEYYDFSTQSDSTVDLNNNWDALFREENNYTMMITTPLSDSFRVTENFNDFDHSQFDFRIPELGELSLPPNDYSYSEYQGAPVEIIHESSPLEFNDIRKSKDSKRNKNQSLSKSLPAAAFNPVTVSGKQLFQCTWANCTKRFTRLATNAQSHWKRHGQMKACYVCEICSMGFERLCDMRRHVNSSH